jgi:thiol-disulfide isomerase/thioredoxin
MRLAATLALVGLLALSVYALSTGDSPVDSLADSFGPDSPASVSESPEEEASTSLTEPPPVLAPPILAVAPPLVEIDGWLQTEATSLAEIDAPVKIVQFWTFGCYNCKNTIPHLSEIYAEYQPQGLEIIGVHAPEFGYERDPDAIAQAAVDLGVTWPIALDTQKKNFRSWQSPRRFWPRTFVLDADGNIRFDRIGEGAYEELEATVAYLLAEAAA